MKSLLKRLKLNESTISMVLGALVIIIVGVLVINYFRDIDTGGTLPTVATEIEDNSAELPTTHTVQPGENLWTISEIYYDNGEKWIQIANANDLTSPGNITEGQDLTIPTLESDLADASITDENDSGQTINLEDINLTITPDPTPTPEPTIALEPTSTPEPMEDAGEVAENKTVESTEDTSVGKSTDKTQDETITEAEDETNTDISDSTYTVVRGDSLWSLAQRAYGDGNKWVDIAAANDLANPNIIHAGNVFQLPR